MKKSAVVRALIMPIFCLAILFGIAVCSLCGISPQTYLGGVTAEKAEFPEESSKALLDGSYQQGLEAYVNENFPFRSYLVKSYSQFLYSVMGDSSNSNVIMGEDNYLIEKGYIQSMTADAWEMRYTYKDYVKNLKIIQDTLEAQGKTFFYIVSPSKAETMVEKIPQYFEVGSTDEVVTQHELLVFFLEEYGIKYYDTIHTVREVKKEKVYSPYTKNGTHWTYYAAARSVSDIFGSLYVQTGVELLQPQIMVVDGDLPSGEDLDLQRLINAPYTQQDDVYAQVQVSYNIPEDYVAPKAYLFGTSFQEQIGFVVGQGDVFKDYRSLKYLLTETRFEAPRVDLALDGTVQEERMQEILEYYDIFFFETNASGVSESHIELVSWMANKLSSGEQIKIKLDVDEAQKLEINTTVPELQTSMGEKFSVAVTLKNDSTCTLKSDEKSIYPFCFAYRIYDMNGKLIKDGEWTALTEDLEAGTENTYDVNITAPEAAGEYKVQITAVQDKVIWVEMANPEFPIYLPISVQ